MIVKRFAALELTKARQEAYKEPLDPSMEDMLDCEVQIWIHPNGDYEVKEVLPDGKMVDISNEFSHSEVNDLIHN
jgi:hypothetical protein